MLYCELNLWFYLLEEQLATDWSILIFPEDRNGCKYLEERGTLYSNTIIDALTRVDQEIVSLKGANKLLFHLLLLGRRVGIT